jgi:hypothetical protein
MRYLLLYNEKTAQFKIVEVGKTITSRLDSDDYKKVGSSDDSGDLKTFVVTLTLLFLIEKQPWPTLQRTTELFDDYLSRLEFLVFKGNDF